MIALSLLFERKAFSEAFHKLGWRVTDAFDLVDVFGALKSEEFEIVLTDDSSFIRVFSETKCTAKADVVAVANESEEAVKEAWSAGADWVVVRPVDPDDPLGFNQR